jgi:hypothetical protein
MGGKSVSRGRAFRQGILPWRKGADIPVGSRYAACRPQLTAAQGPRVEQRAILARPFQKNQSKAGPGFRCSRPGFRCFGTFLLEWP